MSGFSNLEISGLIKQSVADSLTAHAGGGQTSALVLAAQINRITTVATAGDSVALPAFSGVNDNNPSKIGARIIIINAGANPMQVFGQGAETIDGVAAATGVSQSPGSRVEYECTADGVWRTAGLTSVVIATRVLTAAEIKALFTTEIQLVPAPGAGRVVMVDEIVLKIVFGAVAYTGANALEFRYTDKTGAKVTADIASTFINTALGTAYASVKGVVTALTPVANAKIVVNVSTANPAAGDSLITITVRYHVVTP